MNFKRLLLIWAPVTLGAILLALPIAYFGPTLRFRQTEKLLANLTLSDGSVLLLVQTPNQTWSEPYTVHLYRLFPTGKAESCLIGFEESYWWFAGLKPRKDRRVNVTFVGEVECIYDPVTGSREWTDKSYPLLGSQQEDYIAVSNKVQKLGYRFKNFKPQH